MKRLFAILPLLTLIVISCTREPYADFIVSEDHPFVGEDVRFTSLSTNADYVEWDMDDGYTYSTGVVDHYFVHPGRYDVTLRAFGTRGGVSTAVIPIQVIGSEITIEVREVDLDFLIPDVEIYLFETLEDWDTGDITLAIGPFYTNSYGEVTIDGLSYQKYYVDAYYQVGNSGYVNWLLGQDDVYWIETQLLTGWQTHFFTAYVEPVEFTKKKSEETRTGRLPMSPAAGQLKAAGERVKKENKSSTERERK